MSINEYIEKIFEPADNDWKAFAKHLASGEITIGEVNTYKKKLGKNFKYEFKKLMEFEKLKESETELRFKQIDYFDQLQNLKQIVESLKIIKETDNLTGNFTDFYKIEQLVGTFAVYILFFLI